MVGNSASRPCRHYVGSVNTGMLGVRSAGASWRWGQSVDGANRRTGRGGQLGESVIQAMRQAARPGNRGDRDVRALQPITSLGGPGCLNNPGIPPNPAIMPIRGEPHIPATGGTGVSE
jgi:hypothetical protein